MMPWRMLRRGICQGATLQSIGRCWKSVWGRVRGGCLWMNLGVVWCLKRRMSVMMRWGFWWRIDWMIRIWSAGALFWNVWWKRNELVERNWKRRVSKMKSKVVWDFVCTITSLLIYWRDKDESVIGCVCALECFDINSLRLNACHWRNRKQVVLVYSLFYTSR